MDKRVPEVRFKGFTDDWEQHKIGDFLKESRIKGSSGLTAKKLTVKLWGKGIVPKEDIYLGSTATQYYIRKEGQFMYGKLDFLHQAFGIVPSYLDGYESTLDSPSFDISKNLNPNFFLEYVSLEKFYKYQGSMANGSRKAKRIHPNIFFEMPILITKIDEQNKIGSIIEKLNLLIELHQKKLNLYESLKKYLLQNLFPSDEEKVPNVRFADFSGDWGKRKFSELYEKMIEKNDLSFNSSQIISVANMYYKSGQNTNSTEEYMKTYNIFLKGDIAYEGNKSKNFSYGRFVENDIGNGIVSHVFDVFRPKAKYDLYFWKYLINNENIMGYILRKVTTKATMMNNLVAKDFLKQKIKTPDYKEQENIGALLKQLDNFTELQEDRLLILKKTKKYYLQKLFI